MPRLPRVTALLAALLSTACVAQDGLCTPARDPDDFYCNDRKQLISSKEAARSAGVGRFVLRLESGSTDTLTPDGEDATFRITDYVPSRERRYDYEVDDTLRTTTSYWQPIDCDDRAEVLDSAVLVPQAVRLFEREVEPLVLDATTRTAFRQLTPCLDPVTEVQTHWAFARWTPEGTVAYFVRFDPEGEVLDLLGPCDDFRDVEACAAAD